MYGNYCNLSCVMCQPHNSTTKSNELRDSGLSQFFHHEQTSRTYSQWQETKKDVLDHIHLIDKFHLTGGEPLLLPKHWELMMEIPDDMAKNISLTYDTNFTSLKYKTYMNNIAIIPKIIHLLFFISYPYISANPLPPKPEVGL